MTRLVLLSGWGCDARIWQPLADHWPDGVSVTAPDWPGYGARPALAAPASLADLAEAMAADLPAEAVWVGWSLGGLLAGALLERLPPSLSPPRGLILLGMGARFCDPAGVGTAQLAAFRRAFVRDPDATLAHFQRWQLGGEPRPRDAHRRLRALLGDGPPPDPDSLAAGLDWLAELDATAVLADPPCPIRRLAGARDPLLAPAALAGADRMLDQTGHCPMLSRPAALAEALVALATEIHRCRAHRAEEALP
jgi:pimeloyl-[acyl-carrier protein] methyl ester esterase